MIGIIDYGMGNLASVRNALDSIGTQCKIISSPGELNKVDKAILPGVGAFGDAMAALEAKSLNDAIIRFAQADKKPFLGICLGMQLLYDESTEFGMSKGLGLITGKVKPLAEHTKGLSIPNIGWCQTDAHGKSDLTSGLAPQDLCFYYVHSYFCRATNRDIVTGTLSYGTECDAIIEADNIFACQFHPEKSQASGIKILQNFSEL